MTESTIAAATIPGPPSPPATAASLLRFDNVIVAFGADPPVLNGLSFDVRRGETRIIMGAAGSGKTILLKTAMAVAYSCSTKTSPIKASTICSASAPKSACCSRRAHCSIP
jgi:ABC-type transporter Mla maintaining outer membrane lipid asymmetry ATPase subunit MlaF